MKSKIFTYSLLVFFCSVCITKHAFSQTQEQQQFLTSFSQLSFAKKISAFDSLNENQKKDVYPFVKDDLETIRSKAVIDGKQDVLNKLQKIDGEIYYINKKYTQAITLFTDLLIQRKALNYKDSVAALYFLKNSYVKVHSLNKAIEIHKIMDNIKKKHSGLSEWLFHPKLSVIYYNMKLYKQCLSQQLLEYKDLQHDQGMVLGYYNNRGLFWIKEGTYDSAIANFNYAKQIFYNLHGKDNLTPQNKALLGLLNGNIGSVYIELKNYIKAIPLISRPSKSHFQFLS